LSERRGFPDLENEVLPKFLGAQFFPFFFCSGVSRGKPFFLVPELFCLRCHGFRDHVGEILPPAIQKVFRQKLGFFCPSVITFLFRLAPFQPEERVFPRLSIRPFGLLIMSCFLHLLVWSRPQGPLLFRKMTARLGRGAPFVSVIPLPRVR